MNICRLHICCSDLSPNIVVQLSTRSGKKIATYLISNLDQKEVPDWRKYSGLFTMPAGEKELVLTMRDNAIGGCGNDFALDDITIRECIRPTPPCKAFCSYCHHQQKEGGKKKGNRKAGAGNDSSQAGKTATTCHGERAAPHTYPGQRKKHRRPSPSPDVTKNQGESPCETYPGARRRSPH